MRLLCDTIASFFASAEVFSNAENLRFSFLLFFVLSPFTPSDVCIYASRS
jgi:hypothetical protein